MDPSLDVTESVFAPLLFAAIFGFFVYLQGSVGVVHVFWFKSIYKTSHPRVFWFSQAPFGLAIIVCCVLAAASFWSLIVNLYLGGSAADIILQVSSIAAGASIVATDFRFGHVWITFRFGWPYPVWRDQNPRWFWFWESLQLALYGLLLAHAVPRLISAVCQLVFATHA